MDAKEALAHLVAIIDKDGTEGLQAFAAKMGIGWHTVYGWYRRGNVPGWRLEAFERAAKGKRKAA